MLSWLAHPGIERRPVSQHACAPGLLTASSFVAAASSGTRAEAGAINSPGSAGLSKRRCVATAFAKLAVVSIDTA